MTRLLTLILTLLVLYGLVEAWPLIQGPVLSLTTPVPYATIPDGILTVTGRVERTAVFTLNDAPLLYDQNGDFSSTLTFPRGQSILTLVATDRFGRTTQAQRTIFVP